MRKEIVDAKTAKTVLGEAARAAQVSGDRMLTKRYIHVSLPLGEAKQQDGRSRYIRHWLVVEIGLTGRNNLEGPELSICATEYGKLRNGRTEDLGTGQHREPLRERGGTAQLRLLELWERWHLNGLRAGCEHQRAGGWDKRPIYPDKPTSAYVRHPDRSNGWNMLTWLPVEHGGLLSAPCPTCGYKYGSQWLYEAIPTEVLAELDAMSGPPEAKTLVQAADQYQQKGRTQ